MPYNREGRHHNNYRSGGGPRGGGQSYRGGAGGRNSNDRNQQQNQTKSNEIAEIKVEREAVPENVEDDTKEENKAPAKKPIAKKTRLFVGNLTSGTTEEEFRKIFGKFGELSEVFVHSEKGFAFVRMDTRLNAENAKYELDGKTVNGRQLRVRYATSGAAISVKNLSPMVSNELLEEAFSKFGQVERAVVIVDDKGKSTTKGIVEFSRKGIAQKAVQQIAEGCFLITSSPRVISASLMDQEDSDDGLPEKNIQKTPQYYSEREAPPRFAVPGTFEEQYARRWKALDDLEREQREQLERQMQASREKLESEMENCMHEHQAMLMKQDLLRRQEELERLEDQRKRELERRQHLEIARMDAHQKEMAERQRRQDILRATIEGTYKAQDYGQPAIRGVQGGYGGNTRSPQVDPHHDVAAVQGQGGLAPAPSRFDQRQVEYAKHGSSAASAGAPQAPVGSAGGNGHAAAAAYHHHQHHYQQGGQPQARHPQQPPPRRSYPDEYDMHSKRQRRY